MTKMTTSTMRPNQHCSKEECIERQGLSQVSELESTVETCRLRQSQRILDPRIAVSKYRRSAAGCDNRSVRKKEELHKTLSHLTNICATLKPTPDHPTIPKRTILGFVSDRLRACQSDATRLMSNPETCVSSSWHARVIRLLVWLRYACCDGYLRDDDAAATTTAKAIDHMRSTAYDAYWNTLDNPQQPAFLGTVDSTSTHRSDDDEMLCYDAISKICALSKHSESGYSFSLETSWNGMLLEFSKRRRQEYSCYPRWNLARRIASHVQREEFYVLWNQPDRNALIKDLPTLAKLILSAEALIFWRYRTVQHYNKSFGKEEPVSDMNRLLGISKSDTVAGTGWSMTYASVFGLSMEESKNNQNEGNGPITMKLKEVVMGNWNYNTLPRKTASIIRESDRPWIFGENFDNAGGSQFGILPEALCRILELGCIPPCFKNEVANHGLSASSSHIENVRSIQNQSSLAKALLASTKNASNGVKDGKSTVVPASKPSRNRPSPMQAAISRVKETEERKVKKKICRFYQNGKGCRYGDKCKFHHHIT